MKDLFHHFTSLQGSGFASRYRNPPSQYAFASVTMLKHCHNSLQQISLATSGQLLSVAPFRPPQLHKGKTLRVQKWRTRTLEAPCIISLTTMFYPALELLSDETLFSSMHAMRVSYITVTFCNASAKQPGPWFDPHQVLTRELPSLRSLRAEDPIRYSGGGFQVFLHALEHSLRLCKNKPEERWRW